MPRLDRGSEVKKAIAVARDTIPAGKRDVLIFDSGHRRAIPGFGVRVFKSGRASFILKYVVKKGEGRTRRMSLGEVSSNDLDRQLSRLRQMAEEIRDHARVLGRDIIGERQDEAAAAAAAKRATRDAPTLAKLAPDYLRDRERGRNDRGKELKQLKASSLTETRRYLIGTERTPSAWADIASLPLGNVDRQKLIGILEKTANAKGPVTADRARVALSGFFSWAIQLGYAQANPTNDIEAFSLGEARERELSESELVEVWQACGDDDHGRITRLLILTGQRRGEIGDLAWTEIDTQKCQIELPPSRTKNRRPHIVPLSDQALALLPTRSGERELVFGTGAGGFSGWSKAKAELDQRIAEARRDYGQPSMKPWVLHDIRRSVVTQLGESRESMGENGERVTHRFALPHVTEMLVNHISGHKSSTAGIYNKAEYMPERRAALREWAAHFMKLVNASPLINNQSARAENKRKTRASTISVTAG